MSRQHARDITRALTFNPGQPPGPNHPAFDDRSQKQRINVATTQHEARPCGRESGQARSKTAARRRRARAPSTRVFSISSNMSDGLLDVAFVDQQRGR
jgi:hypothetical protein